MNEKLQKILEDILKSEEKTKEFSKLKTIEEVYSYFENEVPGLSEDEFEQFIVDIMDGFEENADILQHVDTASLENIAGGKNNLARFGAGALALLTFLPVIGANSASAKGLPAGGNVSAVKVEPKKSKETIKKQENKEPKQIFMAKEKKTPIKEKYSEIKKWLKRLGIGAAITIATIFAAKETGLLDKVMPKKEHADEISIDNHEDTYKISKEISNISKMINEISDGDIRDCLFAIQGSLVQFGIRRSLLESTSYSNLNNQAIVEYLGKIREFASKGKEIGNDLEIGYTDLSQRKFIKLKLSEAVKKLNEYIRKSPGIFGEEIVLKS